MTTEERKKQILEISKGKPVATGTKLIYQGESKDFDVYKVPLDLLIYNVENGRIASVVKSYKREHGELVADTPEGASQISDFLYHSNEERNKKTLEDLRIHGQQEPGIITMDGIIVDGNRRASLLNIIRYSNKYTQSEKDKASYFLTRILPEDASTKEILRLETTYQMASDSKVDYNPLEKYLHTKDMKDNGFTEKEIATYMGFNGGEKEVTKILSIQTLMDEYLSQYQYDGIYTQLPSDCEDKLIKLEASLTKIRSGAYSWIQQDEIDSVCIDLKIISFDYIRAGITNEDYRVIGYTKDANALCERRTWEMLCDAHFKATDGVEEESTDNVLQNATTHKDSKHLLDNRDNEWRKRVGGYLKDNHKDIQTVVESKKEKAKPVFLFKKAISALEVIDLQVLADSNEKEEIIEKIEELEKCISDIKQAIN